MPPEAQQSGVFVLVIFLAVLAERGWQWLRRRAARNWPQAEGRIEFAAFRQPNRHSNLYFVAELGYSYMIDGGHYAGHYRRTFYDAASAASFVAALKGRTIQVRYHPANLAKSLLLEDQVQLAVAEAPEEVAV